MWPFPVKLDYKNSKLYLNKRTVKCVPFAITVIHSDHKDLHYISSRANVLRLNYAILVVAWSIFQVVAIITHQGFQNTTALLSVINEHVAMSNEMEQSKFHMSK